MIKGYVHSIETMGLMDGPGIRTVVFLKGCPLKCCYCHNPETQCSSGGTEYTPQELLEYLKRYKPYYEKSGGGVTFSGGEALLQGAFLIEIMLLLKKENIHIALDTSGYGDEKYMDRILSLVDLLILDVKDYKKERYQWLVGQSIEGLENFFGRLKNYYGELWIRHVMVPGLTDSYSEMDGLSEYLLKLKKTIEKIEILPYHRLGVEKYSQLKREYPFSSVPAMDLQKSKEYELYLQEMLFKNGVMGSTRKSIV